MFHHYTKVQPHVLDVNKDLICVVPNDIPSLMFINKPKYVWAGSNIFVVLELEYNLGCLI